MEKKIGILWVQDMPFSDSIEEVMAKEISLLLPGYEIILFTAEDVSTAYDLLISRENRINLIVTDIKVPEGKKERIEERLHADSGHLWATAVNTHGFGGLNLIKLLTERLRWKTKASDVVFNLPVLYISAWERMENHHQILKLYHQSMTFDWIDLPVLDFSRLAAQRIVDLFRIYEAKLRREAAAKTE